MVQSGRGGGKTTVVLDGQEGITYFEVFPDTLRFTDSGLLTYVAADQHGYYRITHPIQ